MISFIKRMIPQTVRLVLKRWLFNYMPGVRGSFNYYGTKVYFPLGSVVFESCCVQGVFEKDNIAVLGKYLRSGTAYFDIGANIGLMAIPILKEYPAIYVYSFEPSMNSLPYLQRTRDNSIYRDRWEIVPYAVSTKKGILTMHMADEAWSALDSIEATGRTPTSLDITIQAISLDELWESIGRPEISVIKMDIEGHERAALRGATRCITATKPAILIEWARANITHGEIREEELLELASELKYEVFSVPHEIPIETQRVLKSFMNYLEYFLLLPKK